MKIKLNDYQFNLTFDSLKLSELIEIIEQAFPQYKGKFTANNTLLSNFEILINDQDVHNKEKLNTYISNEDEIEFTELAD